MKLDDVKKLHQKKYRAQFGYFLVEGEHLILELQKAAKTQPEQKNIAVYMTEEYQRSAPDLSAQFITTIINKKQMAQLSDTKTPPGIIACVPLPETNDQRVASNQRIDEGERAIYLHEVQDPGNLGTILRTLAWFGKFRLILSPNCVDPFNPKVVRASMGAIFHVPIELDVPLSDLPNRFKKLAYLDMHGHNINTTMFTEYNCYLFGNEARGVPLDTLAELNGDAFTINGSGLIDSLNLASAVNICVYQLSI